MATSKQPEYDDLMRLLGRVLDLAKHSIKCAQEEEWENDCDCGLDEASDAFNEWQRRQ